MQSPDQLARFYREQLLKDNVPFWEKYSPDREHGGFLTCLDWDGSCYCTDKFTWLQGRAIWMFARLYNTVEKKASWLELAKRGLDFLAKHGFLPDEGMYFRLDRQGRPLAGPYSFYAEIFAIIAFAEMSRATGDDALLRDAKDLFRRVVRKEKDPKDPIGTAREFRIHGERMCLLSTAQEILLSGKDPEVEKVAAYALDRILHHHMQPKKKLLFENVTPGGKLVLDCPEGRCINPGHAIETAWFVMAEGERKGDKTVIRKGLEILDAHLAFGWDVEFDGFYAFMDSEGKPTGQIESRTKLWWAHNEALNALSRAWRITKDEKYRKWFVRVHDYSFARFADPKHGGWYGNLDRRGEVTHTFKGSAWKGFFHVPRCLLECWQNLSRV